MPPVKVILGSHQISSTPGNAQAHYTTPEAATAVLDLFASYGHSEIDTARNYVGSEILLGEAKAPLRFTIHTKVLDGLGGDGGSHSAPKIAASIDASLRDLGVASVESVFLHVPDRQTPFVETASAINDAFQQGKFRRFGLSNYTAAEVQRYVDVCKEHGFVSPSIYEGQYNAIVRSGEEELFPILRRHDISFFAYSPAGGGFFAGQDSDQTSERWQLNNPQGQLYHGFYSQPSIQDAVDRVRVLCKEHGITPHAASLRWTAHHSALDGDRGDGVVFGLSKDLGRVKDSLDAFAAGPLPIEVAKGFSEIYESLQEKVAYHL